jgi:KTSC domain
MPVHAAKLKSSWLQDASYDDATQTLTVTTAKGTKHAHQISPDVYAQFLASPSPGKFYNAVLRDK